MNLLSKLAKGGAAVVFVASIAGTSLTAFAATSGQLEGGNNHYQIADLTKGTGFANTQSASQCDTVQYRLSLYNPGPGGLSDVKVEASINTITPYTQWVSTATAFTPTGLNPTTVFQATLNISPAQTQKYVAGSTELLDSTGKVIKSSASGTLADTITQGAGGIDIGPVGESVQEYLQFKAQISCPTPPPPVFTCDELNITTGDNRTVKISTFNVTAKNGATFKNADISWGDGSSKNGANPVVGLTHQYGQDGTFTVAANAHFDVNGQDKTATGPACEKQVTFKSGTSTVTNVTTSSSPTAPTELVNTGPGSVAAWVAGIAVVLGTLAYRWRLVSRRLSRR